MAEKKEKKKNSKGKKKKGDKEDKDKDKVDKDKKKDKVIICQVAPQLRLYYSRDNCETACLCGQAIRNASCSSAVKEKKEGINWQFGVS